MTLDPAVGVTWKLKSETVLVFGLNRSHMRDLGSSVGASCVKFRRTSFLEKSQKSTKIIFPTFPAYQENGKNKFPIFPGYQNIEKVRFPIFPGL